MLYPISRRFNAVLSLAGSFIVPGGSVSVSASPAPGFAWDGSPTSPRSAPTANATVTLAVLRNAFAKLRAGASAVWSAIDQALHPSCFPGSWDTVTAYAHLYNERKEN